MRSIRDMLDGAQRGEPLADDEVTWLTTYAEAARSRILAGCCSEEELGAVKLLAYESLRFKLRELYGDARGDTTQRVLLDCLEIAGQIDEQLVSLSDGERFLVCGSAATHLEQLRGKVAQIRARLSLLVY